MKWTLLFTFHTVVGFEEDPTIPSNHVSSWHCIKEVQNLTFLHRADMLPKESNKIKLQLRIHGVYHMMEEQRNMFLQLENSLTPMDVSNLNTDSSSSQILCYMESELWVPQTTLPSVAFLCFMWHFFLRPLTSSSYWWRPVPFWSPLWWPNHTRYPCS